MKTNLIKWLTPEGFDALQKLRDKAVRRAPKGETARILTIAVVHIKSAQDENDRLLDLVRHARAELHEAGLITNEDYAALAEAEGSVDRLHTYYQVRATLEQERLTAQESFRRQQVRITELEARLVYPAELNEQLIRILSLMNFNLGAMARAMRARGHDIPEKYEVEQAYVQDWMIRRYLRSGDMWWEEAMAELKAPIVVKEGGQGDNDAVKAPGP